MGSWYKTWIIKTWIIKTLNNKTSNNKPPNNKTSMIQNVGCYKTLNNKTSTATKCRHLLNFTLCWVRLEQFLGRALQQGQATEPSAAARTGQGAERCGHMSGPSSLGNYRIWLMTTFVQGNKACGSRRRIDREVKFKNLIPEQQYFPHHLVLQPQNLKS